MKKCWKCKEYKDELEFYKDRAMKSGLSNTCKPCVKEYQKENHQRILQNSRNFRAKNPQYDKAYRTRIKEDFIKLYGGKCSCCGEEHTEFLSIDHINGRHGIQKRNSIIEYKSAVEFYNPIEFRVLCMNCNFAYGVFGFCPHQKEKSSD